MWKRTADASIRVFVYAFMYPAVMVDKFMCIRLIFVQCISSTVLTLLEKYNCLKNIDKIMHVSCSILKGAQA
jgi:hypothetical protein